MLISNEFVKGWINKYKKTGIKKNLKSRILFGKTS